MSEREVTEQEQATDAQIQAALNVVDATLPNLCGILSELDTPERFLIVMAYMLTGVFASRPDLYGGFINLLATFAPVYDEILAEFQRNFPSTWAERDADDIFIIQPSAATL